MGRTPRGATRHKVFQFVRQRLLAGQPPTVREVQKALGFAAVQTARSHLEALVREGRLAKVPGQARGYRLGRGERSLPTQMVPVVGRVQAGALTTALEEAEDVLPVASARPRPGLFALRVRGDSMRDAGILPGDLVVVRPQPTAEPGDIVVALVGDEATVKRLRYVFGGGGRPAPSADGVNPSPFTHGSNDFLRGGGRPAAAADGDGARPTTSSPAMVELWPENPAFAPIRVRPEDLQLLGKVIEVRRLLEPA